MSDWYDVGGTPATNASGSSSAMRTELGLIEAAFALLPTLTGNGDEILKVNAGGTAVETVASLGVAQGGTGASTHTDGGVLIGKGTAAVESTGLMADDKMIVGDGTTNPVLESGATLRTSIGVGTGDSPTFTNLTLSGAITSLGTDLSVANGGTGVSTITDGGVLIGKGTAAVENTGLMADDEMIVGDGTTNPVLESGTTLRDSIGIGTGDSPTFAGLTLSGTPMNVASGGTGAATLGDGFVLLGSGTSPITALDVTAKGSILAGDGTTDPIALVVGNDGEVLLADSGEDSGLIWGVPVSTANSKVKTANQSSVGEVLIDDDHLVAYSLVAATYYIIEGCLFVDETTGGTEMKLALQTDNAFVASDWGALYGAEGGSGQVMVAGASATAQADLDNLDLAADNTVIIRGYVQTHATLTCTVDLQWAELNEGGVDVDKGSWLKFTPVS